MTRRRLIPEVIQSSAMDCGPACLAALLGGYGVRASYERLREACRTDVDGTSIDTIEEVAAQLGLDAEQNLMPVDHVLRAEAAALPAIMVTRQPDGGNHFVVVWSRVGNRVQVMDPAVGRRWVARDRLLGELYVHDMALPAAVWRGWAGSDDRARPLAGRLRDLGVADADARVAAALADPGWRPVATLDAAVRLVQRFADASAVAKGAEAAALLDVLVADPAAIPDDAWAARATEVPDTVRVRGAVIVRIGGHRAADPASPELRAALSETAPRPWRHLVGAVTAAGRLRPLALLGAIALTALLVVVQAALWRMLFEPQQLTALQLGGALAALVIYLAIELAIEASVVGAVYRLGRRVELGLRTQFLSSIARLGLRYLQSRPVSDLSERSHALYRLRELPWIGTQLVRIALTTVITGAALVWLAPETGWLVVALAAAAIAPPLVAHRALTERELRVRTHHGAITKFFLDALLGAIPARAHGVERPLRREHEARLVEWASAAGREHAFATAVVAAQTLMVWGLAIALVAVHVASTDRPASILLAVYWTVTMAAAASAFTALVRELPAARNSTLRLLEPLGTRGGDDAPAEQRPAPPLRAPVVFDNVSVVVGGHPVLAGVSLEIPVGQHVAVVGPSGSGKSTLLGLLLGWHRPASGEIRIGDAPLDRALVSALRRRLAWVDPAVQLWNDSLVHNLRFGSRAGDSSGDSSGVDAAPDLGAIVEAARLDDVLGRLPEGMQTRLGEGGGLLSGGEAQRVRLGRGLARSAAALVVLDEPFRGLDRARRRELLAAARAHWRGVTLLCATHDLEETQAFDRVLVIEAGRIVEDGAPAALAGRAGSRYATLVADEVAVRTGWRGWRTIRLDGGRAVEVAR